MNPKSKLLSALMSLALALGLCPAPAFAAGEDSRGVFLRGANSEVIEKADAESSTASKPASENLPDRARLLSEYDGTWGVIGDFAIMEKSISYEVGQGDGDHSATGVVTDIVDMDGKVVMHLFSASAYGGIPQAVPDDLFGGEANYSLIRFYYSRQAHLDNARKGLVFVCDINTGNIGVKKLDGTDLIPPGDYESVNALRNGDFAFFSSDENGSTRSVTVSFYDGDGNSCGEVVYEVPSDRVMYNDATVYGCFVKLASVVAVKENGKHLYATDVNKVLAGDSDGSALVEKLDGSICVVSPSGAEYEVCDSTSHADGRTGMIDGPFVQLATPKQDDRWVYDYAYYRFDGEGFVPLSSETRYFLGTTNGYGFFSDDYVGGTYSKNTSFRVRDSSGNLVRTFDALSLHIVGNRYYWSEGQAADGSTFVEIGDPVKGALQICPGLSGWFGAKVEAIYDDLELVGLAAGNSLDPIWKWSYYDANLKLLDASSLAPRLANGTAVFADVKWDSGSAAYQASVTDKEGKPVSLGGATLGIAADGMYAEGNQVKHAGSDMWWARSASGAWGAMNSQGDVLVPFEFESYFDSGSSNDYVLVKSDGVWCLLRISDIEVAPKVSIADAVVTLERASSAYTGKAQKGVVKSVVLGGVVLREGDDYAVEAEEGADAGSYSVTVTGTIAYGGKATATFTIAPAASTVKLAPQALTYTGKALAYTGKVTRSGSSGKVTYSYYSDSKCTKAVKAADVKAAGTYYVKASLAADANHKAATSAAARLTIAKTANPMAVSGRTAAVKHSKKAQSVKVASAYKFAKKAAGKVTYARVAKGSSAWLPKVDAKTGAVAVKAGAPKGKTYTVKVKVTAKGDANRKAASKTAAVKVRVK